MKKVSSASTITTSSTGYSITVGTIYSDGAQWVAQDAFAFSMRAQASSLVRNIQHNREKIQYTTRRIAEQAQRSLLWQDSENKNDLESLALVAGDANRDNKALIATIDAVKNYIYAVLVPQGVDGGEFLAAFFIAINLHEIHGGHHIADDVAAFAKVCEKVEVA
jgi:hypothetical protein